MQDIRDRRAVHVIRLCQKVDFNSFNSDWFFSFYSSSSFILFSIKHISRYAPRRKFCRLLFMGESSYARTKKLCTRFGSG